MGCDIHLFVEVKREGVWKAIGRKAIENYGDEKYCYFEDDTYTSRNYNVFAILADVRNGYGFAGCDLGNRVEPISPPKDLPFDVSPEVREESDRWGIDGHSHSWLTLRELKDYDWIGIKTHRGYVTPEAYWLWKRWGIRPNMWCGGVGRELIKTHEEMDALIPQDPDEAREFFKDNGGFRAAAYTQIEWLSTKAHGAESFLADVLPVLEGYLNPPDITPDDVRIVFWFDN